MKRKTYDPISWKAKVTDEGIKYLEEYRREKMEFRERERKDSDFNLLDYLEQVSKTTKSSTAPDPEFQQHLSQNPAAKEMHDKVMAEILGPMTPPSTKDLWNGIYTALEQSGPDGRLAMSMVLAIGVHNFWSMYYQVRKRHFGNSPINAHEFCWILGTTFQNYANIFRTGELELATKGRGNGELLDLVPKIRGYEIKKLTYRELCDALAYVFVFVRDEEWLRLFVHRAKSKKWL
jgi:hypothetical protein